MNITEVTNALNFDTQAEGMIYNDDVVIVPAMNEIGLGVLMLALAAAAFVALRRV